jgi:hypothetical protein
VSLLCLAFNALSQSWSKLIITLCKRDLSVAVNSTWCSPSKHNVFKVYSPILWLSSKRRNVNGQAGQDNRAPGDVSEIATMRLGDMCLRQYIGARGGCPAATISCNKTPLWRCQHPRLASLALLDDVLSSRSLQWPDSKKSSDFILTDRTPHQTVTSELCRGF